MHSLPICYGASYGVAVGNHDQSPIGDADGSTASYNQFFGESRFTGRAYYGGHYGSANDNHYDLFTASGLNFIVVTFEYDLTPDPLVLHWADSLLKAHSNRRAIVTSHWIINAGNPATFSVQGQAIYDSLKDNSNLFLMLCGHVSPEEGQRVDTFNGNTVYTLMSDYQSRTNGGNGWLRIMEFSPANNEIRVKTYSPWLSQFETDANSQFTLSYNMNGGSFQEVGANSNVTSGSTTNVNWPGLSFATQYEWYVAVSDGNATVTSPTWSFTTEDNPLPIQLLSFTATIVNQNSVRLDWTTASETNNYGFEVQKSAGTQTSYQTILNSFVPGHGTSLEPHAYSYADAGVPPGVWYYRLKQIDLDGSVNYADGVRVNVLTGVEEEERPGVFALEQNYPNPFNPSTLIHYSLAKTGSVSLRVYNTLGQEVSVLAEGMQNVGEYTVQLSANNMASGVYIYRLSADGFTSTRKLILLR